MNKSILLVGGGGHCKSVLDILLKRAEYKKVAIVDKKEKVGKSIMGAPVVGCDDDLPALFRDDYKFAFVTIGSIGNPARRVKIFNWLAKIGYQIPAIIAQSAIVSEIATIERGVFIGNGAIVNANTLVQQGAIINSGAIVEHDCKIGQFCHISPRATLGGGVAIGDYTHVGLGASIKHGVTVGKNSIIGMGSVVLKNISDNKLAYGYPSTEVKKI